jgi:hypothetical protein
MDDKNMRVAELVERLSILGIPPEVSRKLTMAQIRGIFMTLADWLIPEDEGE